MIRILLRCCDKHHGIVGPPIKEKALEGHVAHLCLLCHRHTDLIGSANSVLLDWSTQQVSSQSNLCPQYALECSSEILSEASSSTAVWVIPV